MNDNGPAPILIISGSQHLRRTIDLALRLNHRHAVHQSNLAGGLEQLHSGVIKATAVILDAFLPDPATLALLSETITSPPVPMVLLAGYDLAEAYAPFKAPTVTILAPPFTMSSLTSALREISSAGEGDTRSASPLLDSAAFMTRIAFSTGPTVAVSSPERFLIRPLEEDLQDVLREIDRARSHLADGLVVELVREGNLAMCQLKREGELLRSLPVSLIEQP